MGNGFEEIGALSFFVGFPLVWVMTVVLIGRFGGWAKLGREYPERPQLGGHRFRFQSARMKLGARYGSCLVIGSDPAGLHVAVFFLFRPGHPPLFIPSTCATAVTGTRPLFILFPSAPPLEES